MHNNWEELIPFYIAGTLSKAEASRLENHVAHCDDCRKSLDEWRQIASVVRADAASQMRDLPPLSARVLQVANGQASVRHYSYIPSATPQPTRGYRSASITLIAAVITVVLIGGLLTLMLTRTPQQQQGVALLPSPTATVNTATSLAPSAESSEAALSASPEASQSASSQGLTPQIIVIEPSATPVSPTPNVGTPTIPPTSTIPAPTYVVPTLVYPTPLRLPTRVYPTAVPPNHVQQPQPPTTMPAPESSQELQPFALMQTTATCTLQVAQTNSVVNLYDGPGTNYPVIRTFSSDDQLIALGKTDGGWYRAQYEPNNDQSVGWVQQSLVVTSGTCDNLPLISVTDNALPTPTTIPVQPLVLVSSDVTLYSGPGTNYPIVGTARGGVSYDVQAQSANWYLITLSNGTSAWISAALVQLSPPDAAIPQAATIPPSPAPNPASATVSPAS